MEVAPSRAAANAGQQIFGADARRAGLQNAAEDDAGEAAEEPGGDECADHMAGDIDAGELGRPDIGADHIEVAPDRQPFGHAPQHDSDDGDIDRRQGHALIDLR